MRRTMLALLALQASLFLVATVTAIQGPREFTETDQLRMDKLTLTRALSEAQAEGDACRAMLGPLRARVNRDDLKRLEEATIAAIEEAHPGFKIDRETGRLVAIPPADPPDGK